MGSPGVQQVPTLEEVTPEATEPGAGLETSVAVHPGSTLSATEAG